MDRTRPLTIGVDVGGTKVLAGAVDAAGTVLRRVRLPTPHRSTTPAVVEQTIVEAVQRLCVELVGEVQAVGVGAAGFVRPDGVVAFSPHLSWRDEPLREALQVRLGLPVVVDNDANTTAVAELEYGAARPFGQVLCITLGTGIGGALVVDRRVFRGRHGMAGEFGHMQVVAGGHRCECGNRGCWEQYSSGNALVRDARELVQRRSPASTHLRSLVHDDPEGVTGALVTEAAHAGDESAQALLREVGGWLGVGLAGIVAGFDPEAIVVGGGVSDAGDLLLAPARESMARAVAGRGFRPEVPLLRAELGPEAGFVGAAVLARSGWSASG